MHAKDLIYMAYFDPHRLFDGLTSYIHSMRRHLLTYFLRRATHWAAALSTCTTGGSSAACACRLTIASICLLSYHDSYHMSNVFMMQLNCFELTLMIH